MKFSRTLGVVAVVLLTTVAAKQAVPTPAAPTSPATLPAMPAPAAAQPAIKPTNAPTAGAQSTATAQGAAPAGAAQVTPVVDPAAAPVAALEDTTPPTFGDPKAGQAKAGACAACHGLDGNSADAQYPKLAGQHERYLWRQLHLFKTGQRENPIMQGMAAPLTGQDMRDIGAYFATQAPRAGVADDTVIKVGPNADRKFYQVGERVFRAGRPADKIPACIACHGPSGRGNPGPSYPSLGGQHAAYTVARLQYFRGGGVSGKDKEANTVMTEVARTLSDEDIQGLATYIEGLHAATPAAATAKAH
jgi:cytochrome c553